jgi:hypothetical protein
MPTKLQDARSSLKNYAIINIRATGWRNKPDSRGYSPLPRSIRPLVSGLGRISQTQVGRGLPVRRKIPMRSIICLPSRLGLCGLLPPKIHTTSPCSQGCLTRIRRKREPGPTSRRRVTVSVSPSALATLSSLPTHAVAAVAQPTSSAEISS